jgi:hypothetical protein
MIVEGTRAALTPVLGGARSGKSFCSERLVIISSFGDFNLPAADLTVVVTRRYAKPITE